MAKLVVVGISDQQIAAPPDTLITYALGSCVGICIYDSIRQIGGLAHIFLPKAFGDAESKDIYKFADTAVEELVRRMVKMGCSPFNLTAKIAGGASMFAFKGKSIGEQNIETVKRELQRLKIKIIAEDTGANYGRTVEFNLDNGSMILKTVGKGNKIL